MSKKTEKNIKDLNQKGICGLINLGNTCYLNSILQCLLHLPELMEYMLSSEKLDKELEINKKEYEQKLTENEKKIHELNYQLINEFKLILNQMWEGYSLNNNNENNNENETQNININSKKKLSPENFKKILEQINEQFKGNSQQDAHEVLTNILDSFHLGLNRSFNPGGIKITSSSFSSDLLLRKTLSCYADASHKAVNDSFIEETFFGQLNTIFSCYKCGLELNEYYEPFSSLELFIPIEKNINLIILPLNNKEKIKLDMNINVNMSYEDIYDSMNQLTGYHFDNYVIYWKNNLKTKFGNKKRKILRNDNNKNYDTYLLLNEDIIINEFNREKCQNFFNNKNNELIIFENPKLDNYDEYDYYYNIHLKVINSKNNYYYNSQENIDRIFKARLPEKDEDDFLIFNYIYKYLENFIDNKKNKKEKIHNSFHLNNNYNKKNKKKINNLNNNNDIININNNNIIELNEDKEIIYKEKKYILGIVCKKNINEENDINISIEYPLCPICNLKAKKISEEHYECFCLNKYLDDELFIKNKDHKILLSNQIKNFIENKNSSMQNLISIIIHPYSNFSFINFNKLLMYSITSNLSSNKNKKKINSHQNLYNLFDTFTASEKIENDKKCKTCGNIKFTLQKKEIHKFPKILIIHIKRFKNEKEKNEEKIEFNEEIDLTKYNFKKLEGKYELHSVVFHQGNLESGHYTSIYKYLNTNKWLLCNDTKIKSISENKFLGNNIDNSSSIGDGYILFYRKKDNQNSN